MSDFKILEEEVQKNVLKLRAHIKRRNLASDPKIRIKTKHIKQKIEDRYVILQVLQHAEICNFSQGNKSQSGLWIFEIKEKKKTRTTRAKKKPTPPVENSSPPLSEKKLSTNQSLRGRMSKIAKERQGDCEKTN